MGHISRALASERLGDYSGAVKSLMSVLDDLEASSEWDRIFEWVAADLLKVGENAEAGLRRDTSGQFSLAGDSSPLPRRASPQAIFFVQGPRNDTQGVGARAGWLQPGRGL